MKTVTHRGFIVVIHGKYPNNQGVQTRLIQESSAIGDYDDSLDRPGSSYLWVGQDHHFNREDVAELISQLHHWLDTGRLKKINNILEEPQ